MTEANQTSGSRDRSPAYPIVPLQTALERLEQFEAHFKRSAARPGGVGDAWSIKAKAHADRIAAALRYFGLLQYQGAGAGRQIVISEEGRRYLRAQQASTKEEIIRALALRPRAIAKFWGIWGKDRPADAACLDELVLQSGFSEQGARDFLKVYDATIAYAGLTDSDKVPSENEEGGEDEQVDDEVPENDPSDAAKQKRKVKVMEGERELTTGMLAKDANFRLIVSGQIGVKEIERLIKKLELDKEILADQEYEVFVHPNGGLVFASIDASLPADASEWGPPKPLAELPKFVELNADGYFHYVVTPEEAARALKRYTSD